MRDLQGKVAVVTGSASGIGLGMARAFARAGMRVAVADVEREAGERAARELRAAGAASVFLPVDVTNRAAVEVLARRVVAELGAVHVVCNNAGVGTESPVAEGSEDDWRWMLAVNLEGVRNGVKAFVPLLRERGQGGHIVNTASLSGLLPAAPLGVYTTSKFAVVGLSESLRQELAPHGIGVSTLLPPQVRTNLARSERNRPERFGGPSERENPLAAVLASGMDPDAVGEAVVAGVREGARFIFPDSTYLEPLRAQFQAFLDAMEKAPRVVESAG